MKKGKECQFDIEETEFPGYGVGYYENNKIYIKNTLPGQTVKGKIFKRKGSNFEAKLIEIIKDVDYKIDAKCSHFGACGGCTHQNVPYDKQLEFKEKQVLKLLNSTGISDYEFLGIEKSPEEFEYRNKMEFTFGNMEKDGELTLGMHVRNMHFAVTSVDNCQIVDEDFRIILKVALEYFKGKELPHYKVMSQQGYLRNLIVRKGTNTGELLINIVTTSQLDFDLTEIVDMLKDINYKGNLTGIIHTINDSLSDAVKADSIEVLYGRDYIIENILDLKFKIHPLSFFQTNSKGAEKLYTIVKDFLGDTNSKTVFDLYCGTGTIGQIVAPNAKKVLGIELVEEAVDSANENAKLNGLSNCEFIAGDVSKVIKTVKDKPDVIILDPPRPGVHPVAMEYVLKFNAPEIVYVSCNPKTLVNDLKVMCENGYEVKKVIVMDMFPHTPHVETVCKLSRATNG